MIKEYPKIKLFENLQKYYIRIELRSMKKKLILECVDRDNSFDVGGIKITKNKSKNIYEFQFYTWQFNKVYTLCDRYELGRNISYKVELMDNFYPPNFFQSNSLELLTQEKAE